MALPNKPPTTAIEDCTCKGKGYADIDCPYHNPTAIADVDKIRDKVVELLSDDYACTRVWDAWNYGTMTRDDFVLLSETERVDEITTLIKESYERGYRDAKNI